MTEVKRPRALWAWGAYAAALLWVGLVFGRARGALSGDRQSAFREEGRRIAACWADRLAERWGDEEDRPLLLRGNSGHPDSRAAALLDERGNPGHAFGGAALPPPIRASDPVDQDLGTDPPAWGFWAPVWVEGRRAGTLFWSRDAGALRQAARRADRALAAAWAWFAAAGSLGALFFSRRFSFL